MKKSRLELEQKISELEIQNKELVSNSEISKNEHKAEIDRLNTEWKQKEKIIQEEHQTKVEELEGEIETLNEDIEEKQTQLDRKELKKLASAYKEQEDVYEKEAMFWLKWLMGIGGALVISTIISIWLSSSKVWYDKFEYYVIDLVFLSAVWFCSSQYSSLVKLRNDYANRKTVAQSFHNILNNLAEDADIRTRFIEKATDVLCAPPSLIDKEPVLSKKLVKDTAEIVKAVRG
jgi:hypothetical protein